MDTLQCVFTDLDGTLLNSKKQISATDLQTIQALKSRGIPVFAVTGRAFHFARQVVQDMGFDYPICACNGGHVYDFLAEKTLYSKLIDPETLQDVYEYLMARDIDFIIYTPTRSIFRGEETERCRRWREINATLRPENRISFHFVTDPDFSIESCQAIKLLLSSVTTQQSDAFLARYEPKHTLSTAYSGPGFFDVNAYGVNKGTGVKFLADHYGYSLKNALAMGDHFNDLPMLNVCGYSASPENGQEELKSAARFVTADNDHSPLTQAVEHFFPGLL